MPASLVIREGKRQFTYELRKEQTFIGRDPNVDIVVNDTATSRRHAVIVSGADGTFLVRDLDSKNGTLVNGTRIKEKELQWGDRIGVGPMIMLFMPHEDGADGKSEEVKPGEFQPKTLGVNVNDLDLSVVRKPRALHVNCVFQVATTVSLYDDPTRAAESFLDILLANFKGSRGAVILYGEAEDAPVDRSITRAAQEEYGHNMELREDILKLVRSTGRAFLQEEADFTSIYAPITFEGKGIGALYLDTFQQSHRLNEDDLWVASAAAAELAVILRHQQARQQHAREKQALQATAEQATDPDEAIIAQSPRMKEVVALVAKASAGDDPVLLNGPVGCGKFLVAQTIHRSSKRRGSPFVGINCAGLKPDEIQTTIFGTEGAPASRRPALETAKGGTLFLDEVGELDLLLQLKLLTCLEDNSVRLILASAKSLLELVAARQFREDLYQKLKAIEISIPSLRERAEDLPMLAELFVKRFASKIGKRLDGIEPAALIMLQNFSWPGNVRQLQNTIERAVMLTPHSKITPDDLIRL